MCVAAACRIACGPMRLSFAWLHRFNSICLKAAGFIGSARFVRKSPCSLGARFAHHGRILLRYSSSHRCSALPMGNIRPLLPLPLVTRSSRLSKSTSCTVSEQSSLALNSDPYSTSKMARSRIPVRKLVLAAANRRSISFSVGTRFGNSFRREILCTEAAGLSSNKPRSLRSSNNRLTAWRRCAWVLDESFRRLKSAL